LSLFGVLNQFSSVISVELNSGLITG
jgi:hypothetical protein